MQSIKAIAFDLDGTLVDSAPDIAHALNSALHQCGLLQGQPPFEVATVRGWVGDGPDATIERALAFMHARGDAVTDADPALLRRRFDTATLAFPLAHGVVYPEMAQTLLQLEPLCPMVVVTNKPRALARAVLDAASLLPHFAFVYGPQRPENRKPSPVMLAQAARDLGLAPREVLMVGDGAADLGAAQAAGAPAVLVGWGYGHVGAASAAARIERPLQLVGIVRSSMHGGQHAHGW